MCLWMNLCLLNNFSLLRYPQHLKTQDQCPSTVVTAVWLHLKTHPNWHTVFGATVYSPMSKDIYDLCACKQTHFKKNRNIISLYVCMNISKYNLIYQNLVINQMLYRSINKTTHFKPNNLFFKTFSLMSIIHLYTVYAQGKNKLTVVDFYKNII